MLEQFEIEKIESELQILYSKLNTSGVEEERELIQQAIQERNLKLVRMMPNE